MSLSPATTLLLLLSIGGCATTPTTTALRTGRVAVYHPYRATAAATTPALLSAAESVAVALGAIEVHREADRITAIIPVEDGIRDKLVVEVRDGEISLAYNTQLAFGIGWTKTDVVCVGYSYARESEIAQRIVGEVPVTVADARR